MAGGDVTLLEHAMSGYTAKLDSVHLLKSVEYIIGIARIGHMRVPHSNVLR
jgi:hypothetical protein